MTLMNMGLTIIPISKIKYLPKYATSHSQKLVEKMAEGHPTIEEIGPIHITEIESKIVLIDGNFKIRIAQACGHDSVLAYSHDCKNVSEAIIEHIKRNHHTLNPLKLFTLFEYLKQRNYSIEQINELTGLCNTQYENLIKKINLDEEQIIRFSEYVESLIEKHFNIPLPDYLFTKWQSIPRKKQRSYITELMRFTRPLSYKHFSWPSFRELNIISKPLMAFSNIDDESQVIISSEVPQEKLFSDKPDGVIVKKSSKSLITNLPDEVRYSMEMFSKTIFIPAQTKKGPGILVNVKTGNFVKLQQNEGLLQCSVDDPQQVIVMPVGTSELDGKVHFITGGAQEIKNALKKVPKNTTFQLVSNQKFQ